MTSNKLSSFSNGILVLLTVSIKEGNLVLVVIYWPLKTKDPEFLGILYKIEKSEKLKRNAYNVCLIVDLSKLYINKKSQNKLVWTKYFERINITKEINQIENQARNFVELLIV